MPQAERLLSAPWLASTLAVTLAIATVSLPLGPIQVVFEVVRRLSQTLVT